MAGVYPLLFEPVLLEKVWGGTALERLGKKPARPGTLIGESWELADMSATSASGAGGQAVRSVIANGALRGQTIHDAIHAWSRRLMGNAKLSPEGNFPLLIKFLDARDNLSIQTHPSPAYARAHRSAHLKTECWFIVDVEPGAMIYKGVKPGVGLGQIAEHARSQAPHSPERPHPIVEDFIAVAAVPGTCHTLPSGTGHALGAGLLVAEVQTASDTTFRLYDWGRQGRQLHIKESLDSLVLGPAPRGTRMLPDQRSARLSTTEFFTVDQHRPNSGETIPVGEIGAPVVVMMIAGDAALIDPTACYEPLGLTAGHTVLIPAEAADTTLMPGDGCDFLRVRLGEGA